MTVADQKAVAEARLETALEARGYEDPRPAYRHRLRTLRDKDPALFERGLERFDAWVRAAASDEDALAAWIDYGVFLAELGGPGRIVAVDETGRAAGYEGGESRALILFVPEDERQPAMPLASPAEPSPSQRATYDLLVLGRLSL